MNKISILLLIYGSLFGAIRAIGQNPLLIDRLWEVTEFKVNSPEPDMQTKGLEAYMNSGNGYTTYLFSEDSVSVHVQIRGVFNNPVSWIDDNTYVIEDDSPSTFFIKIENDSTLILTSDKYTYSQKLELVSASD